MADFDKKEYVDYADLVAYDELIKKYIKSKSDSNDALITEEVERATAAEQALQNAIDILNGNAEVDGSVDQKVADAIAGVVNDAPEIFDTLKEIADWISNDETGTSKLLDRIAALEKADKDLKDYIDIQDDYLYNAFQPISKLKILALFAEEQSEDKAAAEAISEMVPGSALKLAADQEINDNITIGDNVYIDANGSTFTGEVKIAESAAIENAVFAGTVIVQ